MSPSPSSSPPTAIPTPALHHPTLSPPKTTKSAPLPWTHEETLNLIRAYQDKWYSLKRGQLKASQWEEVAVAVAAYCRLDEPSKSATQCRHKIEKLRKRYRAEKQKPYPNSWIYFTLMDHLERGPLPISAVALPPPAEEDSGGSEEEKEGFGSGYTKLGEFGSGNRRLNEIESGSFGMKRKRKFYEDEERGRDEMSDVYEDEDDDDVVGELAAEMKGFAEMFVKIERKKMEVMRENERVRMEMENKKMQMILASQNKTLDMISRVFASAHKKLKMKMAQDL